MVGRQLDLGAALTTSFEVIKRYPALAIGGLLIYFGLCFVAEVIPFVNFLASILLLPPLAGGFFILSLHLVDGNDPKLEDLFAGFRAYGKWIGVYWLYALIGAAACLPAVIAALPIPFLGWLGIDGTLRLPVTIASVILATGLFVAALAFLVRYYFTYYVVVETAGIWDSFKMSEEITEGHRLQLFWMAVVLGLVAVAGVIGLGVGILFTYPLAMLAMTALYRQLNPRQAAQAAAPPTAPPGPPDGEWRAPA